MRIARVVTILLLLAATVIAASVPPSRAMALAKVLSLREQNVPAELISELASIEEAFSRGENRIAEGAEADAEVFFKLVLVKATLLEQRRDALRDEPGAQAAPPEQVEQPAPEPEVPHVALPEPEFVQPEPEAKVPRTQHEVVVGGESVYTVTKADTLRHLSAKLGVSVRYLARKNKLDPNKPLVKGQKIRVCNRRIVPKTMVNGLLINIPDRTLYHFSNGAVAAVTPVALGRPRQDKGPSWETPLGPFKIVAKMKYPSWRVPLSIQNEMAAQGKKVETEVPAGPVNPLGKYALRTSIAGILIHGTNLPTSIYGFNSHGCIRVYPDHMEALYREVKIDTPGEIIYQPVKLARTETGTIYLEVHDDAYRKVKDLKKQVHEVIRKSGLDDLVDWRKVALVVKDKSGIAEIISP